MRKYWNRIDRVGCMFLCALTACLSGIVLSMAGCGSRKEELEAVAKDWSTVIRASQVIPVYPLTEDLQPGDIFLVTTPIQKQHEQYEEDGFLPLDSHVFRLQPAGYESFYARSFVVGNGNKIVPNYWLHPDEDKDKAWHRAPQAGFPSYSFSVKRGAGFNGALPISGVPVGLTLLGADGADGTITIDKARTYGVDMISLHAQVLNWINTDPNARAFLRQNASGPNQERYLRVISRVYLTGRMLVELRSTSTSSFGASGGAPKPVELLTATPTDDPRIATADQYRTNIEKLNLLLEGALKRVEAESVAGATSTLLPGASLKVVAASSRSITMAEDFIDRPLVVGYLGFDLRINEDSSLSLPVETRSILNGDVVPNSVAFSYTQIPVIQLRKQIQSHPQRELVAKRTAEILGGNVLTEYNTKIAEGMSSYDAMVLSIPAPGSGGLLDQTVAGAFQRALDETPTIPPTPRPVPPNPPE